jgi:CHAT domain-containing protein
MVSPSARLLGEAAFGTTWSDTREWKFAGFAPIFSDSTSRSQVFASTRSGGEPDSDQLRSVSVNGKIFRALPHSDEEVTNIAAEFGGHGLRSQTFVNEFASEENFKQAASTFTHLHVATHGFVNAQDPARSALLFTPSTGSGTGEDGVLYAALVVLSSCESGVGRFVNGEGVYALMRGFLYSGARNIMYSLWPVMDRHTSELMQAFYEEALKGVRASKALQLAKLRMLANERTAFPFSWAGFVLVGR